MSSALSLSSAETVSSSGISFLYCSVCLRLAQKSIAMVRNCTTARTIFYSVSEKSEAPESDEDFSTHYSWGGVIHTNAPFLFSL